MNKRHKRNRNLGITYKRSFNGLRIMQCDEGVIVNYLSRVYETIDKALEDHPRTTAVRVDLRIGSYLAGSNSLMISEFIASLISQIEADSKRKKRSGKRVHKCNVRYAWVKEKDTALNQHYHMVLFFNKDSYAFLGSYQSSGNLSHMIKKAWATALDIDVEESSFLVNFPKNPTYYLKRDSEQFDSELERLFYRISYFAKVRTKEYGSRNKNFGTSRR
ncbi:inovirus Gp2 family protein [Vibrio splendidus]|uniref:Inovirus Gp2 family protein n=1 Tax=Vibrio splendidus TaxID=29497 RepID=A0A2T5ETT8_VIBSP|nr:inovirus Gp2 family protein [Vibrio splendidus]PMI83792.1 hypothetical protein BCU63_16225 [Vibrio splendidus]PMJ52496.1 hypothetical protein BCU23_22975 [Vibrio splendidus]PTP32444.1 inovirus Gp2 family protein [Vibrio splendidus]PTP71747.1 inovirus Gp2 family protein [Vibrio splendidus]